LDLKAIPDDEQIEVVKLYCKPNSRFPNEHIEVVKPHRKPNSRLPTSTTKSFEAVVVVDANWAQIGHLSSLSLFLSPFLPFSSASNLNICSDFDDA